MVLLTRESRKPPPYRDSDSYSLGLFFVFKLLLLNEYFFRIALIFCLKISRELHFLHIYTINFKITEKNFNKLFPFSKKSLTLHQQLTSNHQYEILSK